MNYRKLTPEEIALLETQGCSSSDWGTVDVAREFSAENIHNAHIENCTIAKNVYIRNVFGELRNISIDEGAYIEAVYSITSGPNPTFGFGYKAQVMSETGGREVTFHEGLTAQSAYLQAFYRHSALLSKKLDEFIAQAVEERPSRGVVGPKARIVNCGIISDCWIANDSRLEGVSKLSRGFVDRAYIGPDVIAEDFIIKEGAAVTDGAHLKGVFVGECVTISGATVHDSLIFANSHIENGEVAASFLGPFSTTMHKSTLLIGGLFSFFNAGSGTNQSNHGYKLGPMHQGITRRGCKTGSDSYILWPAAIGAYTTILGRHYSHPDSRDFPFSILLNDHEGRSILLPAAAAATVGFARDVDKWPRRDRREEVVLSSSFTFDDITNFQWLSPFTIEACLRAINCLKAEAPRPASREGSVAEAPRPASREGSVAEASSLRVFGGFVIPEKAVEKGIKIYKLLINRYIAETLLTKIQSQISVNPHYGVNQIIEALKFVGTDKGHGHWVDLAGMLAPKTAVEKGLNRLINGEFDDIDSFIFEVLVDLYQNYNNLNWSWLQANLQHLLSCSPCSPVKETAPCSSCSPVEETAPCSPVENIFTPDSVAGMLERGADAVEELTRLWQADAAKELDPEKASLGFGIDAYENRQEILDDFARTRGSLAGNKFLALNQRATKEKAARMRMFAQVMRQSE